MCIRDSLYFVAVLDHRHFGSYICDVAGEFGGFGNCNGVLSAQSFGLSSLEGPGRVREKRDLDYVGPHLLAISRRFHNLIGTPVRWI